MEKSVASQKVLEKRIQNGAGLCKQWLFYNILFYYKENRTLHLLSNAEHVCSFNNIFQDYEKMNIGYQIVELANKMTVDYHENLQLFELLKDALSALNDATKNYVNVLFKFEFDLISILGFAVDIKRIRNFSEMTPGIVIERNHEHDYNYFKDNLVDGNFNAVSDYFTGYSKKEQQFLELLKNGNFAKILEFKLLKSSSSRIENFFESHFREHIENSGVFKSKKVLIL